MQSVKGGFSFRLNKNLKIKRDVWQTSLLVGQADQSDIYRSARRPPEEDQSHIA
ncbi:MAG: hypothetical protein JWM83_362 [Candidatus Angelobacter sp.]|nr:hypothetical protein [Candidatus Angelobacter sp.]